MRMCVKSKQILMAQFAPVAHFIRAYQTVVFHKMYNYNWAGSLVKVAVAHAFTARYRQIESQRVFWSLNRLNHFSRTFFYQVS